MNNKVVYGWFADGLPFYIGIGSIRRSKRKSGRNLYCTRKRAKAERENCFEIRILFKNLTWQEACEIEQSLICLYGRSDNGTGILTNMTDGGDGAIGQRKTKETIKKARKSQQRYFRQNDCYWKGKKHTNETKAKIALRQAGSSNSVAKPVSTPKGHFPTVKSASIAHSVSTTTIRRWTRTKEGYNYTG